VEESLRLDKHGVPKVLSMYDPKYGYREYEETRLNKNFNIHLMEGRLKSVIRSSSSPVMSRLHDWTLRTRINRLYFQRRNQFMKKQSKPKVLFDEPIPENISAGEKILNELAYKYKEEGLMQVPDLDEIYRDIDILISKVNVNYSSSTQNGSPKIQDRNPEQTEFLWLNMNAEEILCEPLYMEAANKGVILTNETLNEVSPHSHTELNLTRTPLNLFRHSELECIGIFNEYRKKIK
jgi:hypothetical protein